MKHSTTSRFWKCYDSLPVEIRTLADKNYDLLKSDSRHPSLHFKKVGKVWSVRIGIHHRAIAIEVDDGFLWMWIGLHSEYDKLIA
ncbi:hypothetical protein [Sulfuriferula nivalis]|uniref:Type II toxin-antitoxin system HigB family toxin n=1 Tax=Sulfuriferula nivalis TaxID=2675298 RepID=A0A809SE69_9PROT|nr:hypothetical protein [Sulfuriferula nivalis]BBP01157.1 hypothetical protein SFSGTM_18650 [Sulfuriferula nivalis]